jgi:hypothetical protein
VRPFALNIYQRVPGPSGLVQWRTNYGNLQQGARRHAEYVNIYEAGISDVGWIKRRRHVTITAIAIVGRSFAAPPQNLNYSAGQGYSGVHTVICPANPATTQHAVTN